MRLAIAGILLAPALQGCLIVALVIPVVPHYNAMADTRGRIPEDAVKFIRDGETPLSEILLKLGEPDHVRENGRLLMYRWEMTEFIAIALFAAGGVGDGDYLIVRVDERGVCMLHHWVEGRNLAGVMLDEFGIEWTWKPGWPP